MGVWNEPAPNPNTDPHSIDAGYPYYQVKLIPINGQAGEIFAQVNFAAVDTADEAEALAEEWNPGYDALWSHKQCASRGVSSNGFAAYPQHTIRGA